jgi:NTE family protein
MTALVLSAGGMFGAYQAGAWKGLAGRLRPDIVIGASVGALNAWAIAGEAAPEELIESWLEPECASLAGLRLQLPWRGCFDSRPLHARIERLWAGYRPRTPVAVVATEIPALRPRLFRDQAITWRHLAASCAVLLGYEQIRIEGKTYTDGGLLGALPLWAAAQLGATRVVAIDALPAMPSRPVRAFVKAVQAVAPKQAIRGRPVEVRKVAPPGPLGSLRQAVFWDRDAVERWIARGEADARRLSLQ